MGISLETPKNWAEFSLGPAYEAEKAERAHHTVADWLGMGGTHPLPVLRPMVQNEGQCRSMHLPELARSSCSAPPIGARPRASRSSKANADPPQRPCHGAYVTSTRAVPVLWASSNARIGSLLY